MLSQEQTEKIKEQLIHQVEKSTLPDKKEVAEAIKAMNPEELEEFLKQQNAAQPQGCIFCSIADEKVPSYKIGENAEAIAVLEINPVSRGHVIIIPKIHSDKTPNSAVELAKEISEKIKVLKPKTIEVFPATALGHRILNVIPAYSNETLSSPRRKADEKELQELFKILTEEKTTLSQKKPKKPRKPRVKRINDKKMWLPRRIP